MDRLVQRNVLAMSGRAVEAAGDVDHAAARQDRHHHLRQPPGDRVPARRRRRRRRAAPTPRSSPRSPTRRRRARSIVELAGAARHRARPRADGAEIVPFTAQTRMSGVDLADGTQIRKGAAIARRWRWVDGTAAARSPQRRSTTAVDAHRRRRAARRCVVAPRRDGAAPAARRHPPQGRRQGRHRRSGSPQLRAMGIRTVMITGDNPLTAKAIAAEAGVDDFLAEATPEDKLALIRKEQEGGRLVAMTGDGTNDAPALAQADVGVAMNTGTSAAKEAGNMVDLDSDPTKLIDIVEIGKQLLITRGALTTFSIANDVAKYFAIIPAMFVGAFPGLAGAQRHAPALARTRAILSAVIFNALIIVALIPLALRGVRYRPSRAPRAAAPQPADLRRRRRDRAVHRHQAHRPRRRPDPRLLNDRKRNRMNRRRTARIRPARRGSPLRALLVLTVVCGVALPAARSPASGSSPCRPRRTDRWSAPTGRPSARSLIGQSFTDAKGNALPQWFQSRPSAAGAGYDATASSAAATSARTTRDLVKAIEAARAAIAQADGVTPAAIPPDAVTACGSGLDPRHLPGLRAAAGGPGRAARGLPVRPVRALVERHMQRPRPRLPRRADGQRAPAEPRAGRRWTLRRSRSAGTAAERSMARGRPARAARRGARRRQDLRDARARAAACATRATTS